jgi:hypothetical protein
MGKVYLCGKVPKLTVPVSVPDVPAGTIWKFTSNGTFEVPATGTYQVELHGGGGGGGGCIRTSGYAYFYGGGGGGSGELYTLELVRNDEYAISIGAGGNRGTNLSSAAGPEQGAGNGSKGGQSSFGSITVAGGKGGTGSYCDYNGYYFGGTGGAASGSLATAGNNGGQSSSSGTGGYGNKNNTAQTYGNGGKQQSNGQPGAVIITYLGVS